MVGMVASQRSETKEGKRLADPNPQRASHRRGRNRPERTGLGRSQERRRSGPLTTLAAIDTSWPLAAAHAAVARGREYTVHGCGRGGPTAPAGPATWLPGHTTAHNRGRAEDPANPTTAVLDAGSTTASKTSPVTSPCPRAQFRAARLVAPESAKTLLEADESRRESTRARPRPSRSRSAPGAPRSPKHPKPYPYPCTRSPGAQLSGEAQLNERLRWPENPSQSRCGADHLETAPQRLPCRAQTHTRRGLPPRSTRVWCKSPRTSLRGPGPLASPRREVTWTEGKTLRRRQRS